MTFNADNLQGRKLNIQLFAPDYKVYNTPQGFLQPHKACHALWHYYLTARAAYERTRENFVYEGEVDKSHNYKQLFLSVSKMYEVEPEQMVKFWPNVDMQARMLNLPKLEDTDGARFDRIPEIKTK